MSITTRIYLLAIGAVAMTGLCIGLISVRGYRRMITHQQKIDLARRVTAEARRFELSLAGIRHDIQLLAALPIVQSVADAAANPHSAHDPAADKARLARVFQQLLRANPSYFKIRLIGLADGGREVVRVDRMNEEIHWTPEDALQQKGHRNFFEECVQLPPGELYLSRIDLNHEYGEIEVPHRPTLRAGMRIDAADQSPFGIVLINLDFRKFTDDLFRGADNTSRFYITNADGDYLLHPDVAKTFGFDLGHRFRIQADHPDLSQLFDSNDEIATTFATGSSDDWILGFRKVYLLPNDRNRFVTLGIGMPGSALVAGTLAISREALGATIVLVIVALLGAIIAARVMTRPIKRITLAADRIARGEAIPSLPLERHDEIGVLAGAFDRMVASLRNKEVELVDANARLAAGNEDLEHFAHIAAHDLREPLRKQRNFVDLLEPELSPETSAEARQYLKLISTCAGQMQEMVDAFRALTQLGAEAPMRAPASLRPLIEDCLLQFSDELEARHVRVRFDDFPPSTDLYLTFAPRLYANLIRNALNHVETDGFELHFTAQASSGTWTFGVRNTGSSIPRDKCRDIFNIFRKAGPSHRKGTGLGLTICRKIIERHRGKIFAESGADEVHVQFTFGEHSNESQDSE